MIYDMIYLRFLHNEVYCMSISVLFHVLSIYIPEDIFFSDKTYALSFIKGYQV